MKVVILAAGMGTRLGKLTENKPKCMVEVNGKPLIQYQLDVLSRENLEVLFVGGYKAEFLNQFEKPVVLNEEFDKTNMLWSFYLAIKDLDEDVIVSYGDIIYSKNILSELLKLEKGIGVISDKDFLPYWEGRSEDPLSDLETFRIDDSSNQIQELGLRPNNLSEIQGQYIGLVKIDTENLRRIKSLIENDKVVNNKPVRNAYFTDLLQELIARNYQLTAVPVPGGWIEVDTPEDISCDVAQKRLEKIIEVNYAN